MRDNPNYKYENGCFLSFLLIPQKLALLIAFGFAFLIFKVFIYEKNN